MVSLKQRLILTYSLLVSVFILVLSIFINYFANGLFAQFVQENIQNEQNNIISSIADQYSPKTKTFNTATLMALGMNYVHRGYIISVEDISGNVVWDARECDMEQCVIIIKNIENNMRINNNSQGKFQTNIYPITYNGDIIGNVSIESYGPLFYSQNEFKFMSTLNKFLLATGIIFTVLSIILSVIIAITLSRPILKAANTANEMSNGNLAIRMPENQKIKEIYALSRSVNDLAASLENGERWQKRLTSDIAHELRTPLTTLQGNMEAMIDGILEPNLERLESCHEEIVRLSGLVDDLGKLSILEQESLVLCKTRFDLYDLLYSVKEQFVPLIKSSSVSINIKKGSFPIVADYDRLKQVFVNLISNAIKYTDKGTIEINTTFSQDHYDIAVSDTGIGIDQSELPHLFDRFYRSDKSRNRETGGAGIGLTVVSTIVTLHGGKINVISEPLKGTTFNIQLPTQ